MVTNIERLLRLTSDYHNFCSDDHAKENAGTDLNELSAETLDFVSAAISVPMHEPKEKKGIK